MSDVWAVIVARTGPTAKSRLATILGPDERAGLALAMLADVLDACAEASLGGPVAVVDTSSGRDLAATHGATVLADPERGMNAAIAVGLAAAESAGAGAALVLPGDVPLVRADDLRALLEAAGAAPRAVVLVPDRAGVGTNALLLRPPRIIDPAFGPNSAARHFAAARASGATALRVERPSLGLDVDTPADLDLLRHRESGGATGAALSRLVGRRGGPGTRRGPRAGSRPSRAR